MTKLEIQEQTSLPPSHLDLYLGFDKCGHPTTRILDKQNDFNFYILTSSNLTEITQFPLHMR